MTRTNTPTKPQPTGAPTPTLSAADRCDRCGSQAYVKFEHPSLVIDGTGEIFGGDASGTAAQFLLCAHHNDQHKDALAVQGFSLAVDETWRLQPGNRQQGKSY